MTWERGRPACMQKKPENAGGTPVFPAKPEGFAITSSLNK